MLLSVENLTPAAACVCLLFMSDSDKSPIIGTLDHVYLINLTFMFPVSEINRLHDNK